MAKIQTLVLKATSFYISPYKDNLWTATLVGIPYEVYVNGTDALGAPAGPRLQEVLDLMGSSVTKWPVKVGKYDDFELTHDGKGHYLKIELTREAYVDVMGALGQGDNADYNKDMKSGLTIYGYDVNYQWERLPNDMSRFVKGYVRDVFKDIPDGDTIGVVDGRYGIEVVSVGDKVSGINPGDIIRVRFVGVDTPETKKGEGDDPYSIDKNNRFAKKYGMDGKDTWDVADEAALITRAFFLQAGGTVIVDLDTRSDGTFVTTYGRYVGMVFKPPVKSFNEALPDNMCININKTLMATRWSGSTTVDIPLAMPSVSFGEGATRFPEVALWENSISAAKNSRQQMDQENKEFQAAQQKLIDDERAKLKYNNESTVRINKVHVTGKDTTLEGIAKYYNTTIDAIVNANGGDEEAVREMISKPGTNILVPVIEVVGTTNDPTVDFEYKHTEGGYDNSLDFFDAVDDRREMDSKFHLRIGDCQFVVPPISIDVNRVSNLEKVKALRTKSSIITKAASSNTAITVQLYFHDLESINGYEVITSSYDTYSDYVPEFMREQTKQTITESYYMDGLRSLIAQFKKAPFLPIENEYINDVLGVYSVALINLSVSTVPGFPHSLAATLTLAKFEITSFMPTDVSLDECINYPMFRWYYQDVMNPKNLKDPYKTYLHPIKGELTNDFYFELANEEQLKERQEAIKELRFMDSPALYQDKLENGTTEHSKFWKDYQKLKKCFAQQKLYNDLKKQMGDTFPTNFDESDKDVYFGVFGEGGFDHEGSFKPKEFMAQHNTDIPDAGEYQIHLESMSNINRINPKYIGSTGGNVYRFPADPNNDGVMVIKQNGESIEFESDTYAMRYTKLTEKATQSEGILDMVPYNISDMWITNLQVMYENSFAPIQVQNLDSPSLQYLGSQDPYVQVTFETTERAAITSLRFLLEETERYSREYRYGISSGFVGFQNQLTKLFGVSTVMPESMRVSTVPGFADRFQIQLTLCGFNKTQKRTESLNGFMGAQLDTKLDDRNKDKNPVANDIVVIERKMRDLEVYPDMELPTVAELNAALKKINAGLKVYHNPQGAKFVDPDFYISTKWTYRKHMLTERTKNTQMSLRDLAGLSGTMSPSGSADSPNVDYMDDWQTLFYFRPDVNSDFGSVIATIDSYTTTILTDDAGIGNNTAPNDVSPYYAGSTPEVYESMSDVAAAKEYAKNAANVFIKPTIEEWVKWNSVHVAPSQGEAIQASYENYYKNLQNPSQFEVYKEIYKWIDYYFVQNKFAVPNDIMAGLKGDVYEDLTYARMQDFFKASYLYLVETDPKFVNEGSAGDPEGMSLKQFRTMSESYGNKGVPKIPVERLANYVKALFHQVSSWKQYMDSGYGYLVPKLTDGRVGIGRIPLASHAKNIEMVKRLAWDWRYNIEYCIGYFLNQYTSALLSSDIDIKCRPWDWAVRGYHHGSFTEYPAKDQSSAAMYKGRLDTPEFQTFMLIFEGDVSNVDVDQRKNALYNHPDAIGAAPGNPSNSEIFAYKYKTLAEWQQVRYNEYASGTSMQVAYNLGIDYRTADAYNRTNKREQGRLLISDEDPRLLHRDMFNDMSEYDQRGRLIRAFPTFQMFIIDEGRWMTSYKLWDNLYGFNSIQSIDVYKSRKIAADTALIKMTNVYSNLTSRSIDENYGDWSYSFWDNLFWGNPSESIVEARKELANAMMLKTGARIHLRMGYSGDAAKLPVVFNGTITEMDTQEVVTIVAQGDGVELSSVISADPKETNDGGWFKPITEPRDLLCGLLTSRGNWFKDWMNSVTNGKLWGDSHPLGIMHFGNPLKVPPALVPFNWFNEDYGEAAQNIYSSNGAATFSEWTKSDGTSFGFDFTWKNILNPMDWTEGDEQSIEIKLEGQTTWKVAQTLAYTCVDHIAAVHPFELRSTLFFGKPYYRLAYRYDSAYQWNSTYNNWDRKVTKEVRKPFMQYHIFDSETDIVANKIKASEEGMYTNVIATYEGGGPSDLQMADWDIRYDKQKTATVQAPIVARWGRKFWHAQDQANSYAQSTLRDYIKDMYKGQLIVLGDPSVKPHDMCYMNDDMNDMNGPFLVKEVAHHFSYETGFITSVSPDAIVIVDDKMLISTTTWFSSFCKSFIAYVIGRKAGAAALRRLIGSTAFLRGNALRVTKYSGRALGKLAAHLPGGNDVVKDFQKNVLDFVKILDEEAEFKKETLVPDELKARKTAAAKSLNKSYEAMQKAAKEWDVKGVKRIGKMSTRLLLWSGSNIVKGFNTGRTTVQFLKTAGTVAMRSTVIGAIASVAISFVTETLIEMWKRKKKSTQAVLMIPMSYQGRQFTAGINGHRGMVVGDEPGKWDKFFMGMGEYGAVGGTLNFLLDGGAENMVANWFGADTSLTRGTIEFSTSYADLNDGTVEREGGLIE